MVYDHLGNPFNTIKDMCKHWNVDYNTYRGRIRSNWTIQEALLGKQINFVYDHLGNPFNTIRDMCKHWNISETAYRFRRNAGWTLQETFEGRGPKVVFDHTGKEFNSVADMCKHWNIHKATFNSRRKASWSIEKALTTPCNSKIKDHTGREFDNQYEMCKHWGISKSFYNKRIKLGMTVEEALTTPYSKQHSTTLLKEISKQIKNNKLTDHLGNEYTSLESMCSKYGIEPKLFLSRIKSRWSIERALTEIPRDKKREKMKDIEEQASKNGITSKALHSRLKRGTPVEEAISKPLQYKTNNEYKYNGKCYESLIQLCREYNAPYGVVRHRVIVGWDLESALNTPVKVNDKVRDHNNKEFDTKVEICKHWRINVQTYDARIRCGWSIEKALTTPIIIEERILSVKIFGKEYTRINDISRSFGVSKAAIYNRFYKRYKDWMHIDSEILASVNQKINCIKLVLVGLDGQARYSVPWSEDLQTTRQVIAYERPDLLELYDKANPKGEYNPYMREELE